MNFKNIEKYSENELNTHLSCIKEQLTKKAFGSMSNLGKLNLISLQRQILKELKRRNNETKD